VYNTVVTQFMQSLETHLFAHHQTVLVGDDWTLADVVVALYLLGALEYCREQRGSSVMDMPQQVHRWVTSVLHTLSSALENENCTEWTRAALYVNYRQALEQMITVPSPLEQPATPVAATTSTTTVTATTSTTAKVVVAATTKAEATATITTADSIVPPVATKTINPTLVATTSTSMGSANDGDDDTASDAKIKQLLTNLGLQYTVYDHAPCMTAEELVANVPLADATTETHTKNLFLRDKKHGLFLVTVSTQSTVSTKDLGSQLGLSGKVNLRLADAAILSSLLQVQPGHVGPLCLGLASPETQTADSDSKITLVLDKALVGNGSKYAKIHSHPARNDQSVVLSPTDFVTYVKAVGFEPVLLDFAAAGDAAAAAVPAPTKSAAPATTEVAAPKKVVADKKTAKKGETLLALQWKKDENFAMWYSDVIVLSEMISYYDISGCYILRPWSYKMWELIQEWFNGEIQKMGVENAYFPLFVSQERLEKEKDHVEGFAPEVAWVTKSGDGDLARPIAIRPTSETIMYPAYSDWIKSHRDLPLKLNQWSNVVRWEFKYPTPFLRTREFLWQEGHTAHSTFDDADETVMAALELYRRVYEDLLAVPVVPGYKTEKEKFAGGYRTTTVEAYVAGSGRAIQGATSHNLGQNFGKMFDIKFQDEKGESQIAWQTSWGLTTRTIGVMVMVHGDDTGLVLPPRIAPLQVVIVPIVSKNLTHEVADPYCLEILTALQAVGVRAKYDDRRIYNPGWKYNHWEQKGVPMRMEVGPRDIEQKSVRLVIRHNGVKEDHPVNDAIGTLVTTMLADIQAAMFAKAKQARDEHLVQVTEWKDFVPNLEKNNMVLTPWCGGEHQDWEQWVKDKSKKESLESRGIVDEDDKTSTSVAAKTLCIPFTQPELPPDAKCIASGKEATCWVLWGRSY
jgi:prolyl-tRNA synthetase